MPFEISPSPSVIVDMTDAGPDDVLRVANEDGSRLFFMRDQQSEHHQLRLVPELIPREIRRLVTRAAKEFCGNVREPYHLRRLADWYYGLPEPRPPLLDALKAELLASAWVLSSSHSTLALDVGLTVRIRITSHPAPDLGSRIEKNCIWDAGSPIATMISVTRFDALVEFSSFD